MSVLRIITVSWERLIEAIYSWPYIIHNIIDINNKEFPVQTLLLVFLASLFVTAKERLEIRYIYIQSILNAYFYEFEHLSIKNIDLVRIMVMKY